MQEYHREHPNSIGLYVSMTYENIAKTIQAQSQKSKKCIFF